ncbi:MAG: flippase-like domain-containing protein [Deltaproteobacteria bacterium]|nr:flippase-like domain-containing protein [Deltaproteobacteria bacterium]
MTASPPPARDRPRRVGHALVQILKVGIVVGALTWLALSGRLALSDLVAPFSAPAWAALGAGLTLIPFLVAFYRLSVVLGVLGVALPLRQVVRIGFVGSFFNTFLPGGLGGDVVKLAWLVRATGDAPRVTAAVLLDRGIALLGILALGGGALLAAWPTVRASSGLQGVALAVLLVVGGTAWAGVVAVVALARGRAAGLGVWAALSAPAALLALRADPDLGARLGTVLAVDGAGALAALLLAPSLVEGGRLARLVEGLPSVGAPVRRFVDAVLLARHRLPLVGLLFLLSVASQSVTVLAIWAIGRALDAPPTLAQLFATVPVAMVINSMPVPGGGLGVGEAALATLLERFTVDGRAVTGGAALFLAWRVWVVAWGLLGLPAFLARRRAPSGETRTEDARRSLPGGGPP